MNGIQKAIRILGSRAALAKAIGVTRQAVHFWERGGRIDETRVLPIVRATLGGVTPHELRPDLYDKNYIPEEVAEWICVAA